MTFDSYVITGATGNTGSAVVERLAQQIAPSSIVALVRDESDTANLTRLGVRVHACDLSSPDTYRSAIPQGAAFIGISNLRHADSMMTYLVDAGIGHAFCITTTAVFSSYHSYGQHYREIEDRLTQAQVNMTLLRPSMIYGNMRDHNMHKLIRVLDRTPVFPVFGPGTALMQPVHVDDLADGIVAAVERRAIGAYNLAGPIALTYNEILKDVSTALGKNTRLVHVPHGPAARMTKLLERLPGFPVKHEQVMRLMEDKSFDIAASVRDLDYQPRSFSEGIATEVEEFRSIGR